MEEKYEQNNLDEQVQDESFTELPLPQIAVEQIDDQSKLSEVYVGKITALRFHPFFLTMGTMYLQNENDLLFLQTRSRRS